ncbi:MAG: exonuclease SbcCD subunit D C-terminal domain-containing protein [Methanoregula sp.]|nr:exonuclease SbcCD subunit D C-terminal domain-containing protein [Methanoregula sp.]
MKILHTSDWHLGHTLYGKKRYEEFESFLNWLIECITTEHIDVVLISGDIFDNSNPGIRAIELYFDFLGRIATSDCQHLIVTAGNHDSPALLNAPKELLRSLNIHAIGSISEKIDDEVLILKDSVGTPFLIVCAVPFLHDREIRTVEPGEDIAEKTQKLLAGIRQHYQRVHEIAESKRSLNGVKIPIITMGHLFVTGGCSSEGDGVRELYLGNLARVGTDTFSPDIDYVALGHLHAPQILPGQETIRYCGAPLSMGFSESKQKKIVIAIEFNPGKKPVITEIPVPRFQEIASLTGDFSTIANQLQELKAKNIPIWVEIILTDQHIIPNIQQHFNEITRGSNIEILKITNTWMVNQIIQQMNVDESLSDLDEREVFNRCLKEFKVPPEQQQELIDSFNLILDDICQNDELAEADHP